jgi:putative FmdB family regulatory protein
MPAYPYHCDNCPETLEVILSIHDYCPERIETCPGCGVAMFRTVTSFTGILGRKVGGDTGFYDLDYGKRATEDLTYKAKQERLRKDGRFHDPFADTSDYVVPTAETVAAFAD